jgi:hypothetical protein
MKKLLIFCENYLEIDQVAYLAAKHQPEYEVTLLLLGYSDLCQFYQTVNKNVFHDSLKIINVERYHAAGANLSRSKKALNLLRDILKERQHLKRVFKQYLADLKDCDIYFFSPGYDGMKLYFVKRLSAKNRLLYVPSPGISLTKTYIPLNPLEMVNLLRWKLTYGLGATIGKIPFAKGFITATSGFLKQVVSQTLTPPAKEAMKKEIDLTTFRIFDGGNFDVIYFDDNLLGIGYYPDKDQFRQEMQQIFKILVKYIPENKIGYKYHPGFTGDTSLIQTGVMIPSYIPAELLHNDKTALYFSVLSWCLTQVEKGMPVSIANLITFKDDEQKRKLTEFVIQNSNKKIIFPGNLDEFEQIVATKIKTKNNQAG